MRGVLMNSDHIDLDMTSHNSDHIDLDMTSHNT